MLDIAVALNSLNRVTFVAVVTAIGGVLITGCATEGGDNMKSTRTSQRIPGPAGQLHFDDGGAGGTPVVFLHSYAGNTAHWSAQLAHLRNSRRALAIDLRGHGQSDAPADGDYSVQAMTRDVAAVVDARGLERFVLVGHSLGGSVAAAYAGAFPSRVAGLVLVGAPGKSPQEQSQQIMSALQADYEKVMQDYWNQLLTGAQPQVRAQLTSEMESVPREASLKLIEAVFAYDPLPALRNYPGPKLIITPALDDQPNSLHRLLPEIPNVLVTDTSHWPHLDRPQEFNQLLDEFLVDVDKHGG